MKKFGLFFSSMFLSVFLLTSCLEGGSVQEGTVICVLDYGNTLNPVLRTPFGYLSAPNLNNLISSGGMVYDNCYVVAYRMDDKLPENAPGVVDMNGYTTITILDYNEIPKYSLKYSLTDTSTICEKEMPILGLDENYGILGYLSDYLFTIQVANHPSGLELSWDLSYDYGTMMTVENDKRYYELYLRATVRKETEQTSKSNIQHVSAFYMGSYLRSAASLEQSNLGSSYSASSSTFTIRFHYVTGIDEEENITWKEKTVDFPIYTFIEN